MTASPRAEYLINFTTSGTYTIWLRGYPANAAGDSTYLGVGDEVVEVTGFAPGAWNWVNLSVSGAGAVTVPVEANGLYTVSLWMREDGLRIDRLLLTTDTTFIPTGFGPTESERQGSAGSTSLLTRTIVYTYDNLYRLTDADYSTGEAYDYKYDPVGNRLKQIIDGNTTDYLYDAANRLESLDGQQVYTFDNNGNLLNSDILTNTWDAANRLTASTRDGNTIQPIYNGVNDRVGQVTTGVTTTFALDVVGLPEVIYTSEGNAYLHLPGVIVAESSGNETRYLLSDGLGSVRQAVDDAGVVVAYNEFDPYGNPIDNNGGDPYGYTGEWWQDEVELLHLRARWYAPSNGTFLSRDALFAMPAYTYASNNPINRVDPSGFVDWNSCVPGVNVATCALEFNDSLWGIAREILAIQGIPNAYNRTNLAINQHIDGVMVPQMQALNPNLYSPSFGWNCPTCLSDNINLPASWVEAILSVPTRPPQPATLGPQGPPIPPQGNPPPPLPPSPGGCPLPKAVAGPVVHKIGPVDIILFPDGPPDLNFGYENKTAAKTMTGIGVLLDVIETGGALYPYSGVPEISAVIDLGVAGLGSIFDGETYVAQPHPDLPTMVVLGQDVLVASAETTVGTVGKWALTGGGIATGNPGVAMAGAIGGIAVDTATSASQAAYDASRLFGVTPTVVSVGGYLDDRWRPRIAFMFYNPF